MNVSQSLNTNFLNTFYFFCFDFFFLRIIQRTMNSCFFSLRGWKTVSNAQKQWDVRCSWQEDIKWASGISLTTNVWWSMKWRKEWIWRWKKEKKGACMFDRTIKVDKRKKEKNWEIETTVKLYRHRDHKMTGKSKGLIRLFCASSSGALTIKDVKEESRLMLITKCILNKIRLPFILQFHFLPLTLLHRGRK